MRGVRKLAAGITVAAAAWALGLAWFIHDANRHAEPPPRADGIVVFTGGAERVEAALHLLQEGRSERLLVSGIGGGADLAEIARLAGVDPAALAGRVKLGRAAHTTRGNADETAAWARANGVRSLIVVTAGYHMQRALTELARALPEVEFYPVTVMPPAMQGPGGLRDAGTLRLMVEEYTKWLAATLGLTGQPAG
ncbi:MAG: YdcF family protein [Acidobacteria bacterium]|nr:YdcF family protein [Acidobacteriota bacterium]